MHPAHHDDEMIGALAVGHGADITVLNDLTGAFTFRDNGGAELRSERMLQPAFCLRDGVHYDADANILPDTPGV